MGYVEWTCPKCGKLNHESCNAWVYGSPIRYCKKCGAEYFDNRWRELAIDGIAPGSKNAKFYLGATAACLLFAIATGAWLFYDIKYTGGYPIKLLGCCLLGIIGVIACFVVFIRIVTGYEDRHNKVFLEESEKRLQDKAYVQKLVSYGYNIPDKYL